MRNKKAFTLIEIVLSIVILGFLASLAFPSFVTAINRTYAKDALNNLLSIQAAQISYKQKNLNPAYKYCTVSCNSTATINSILNLNINSDGTVAYNCSSGGNVCHAIKSGSGAFDLMLTLDSPGNAGTGALYCGAGHNPCCVQGTNVAGDSCP